MQTCMYAAAAEDICALQSSHQRWLISTRIGCPYFLAAALYRCSMRIPAPTFSTDETSAAAAVLKRMFQCNAKSNDAREILLTTHMTRPSHAAASILLPLGRKWNRQQSPAIARKHAASAKARFAVVCEEQHHLGNVARGSASADGVRGVACCVISEGEGGERRLLSFEPWCGVKNYAAASAGDIPALWWNSVAMVAGAMQLQQNRLRGYDRGEDTEQRNALAAYAASELKSRLSRECLNPSFCDAVSAESRSRTGGGGAGETRGTTRVRPRK